MPLPRPKFLCAKLSSESPFSELSVPPVNMGSVDLFS